MAVTTLRRIATILGPHGITWPGFIVSFRQYDEGTDREGDAITPQDERRSSVVTEVAKWPIEGREGRILVVEYPPGVHTPPHRHPGWQFIHVLEGTVVHQMEGEEAREYEPGEAWYETRDHLHLDIGNDSPDTWAKIVVFYLTEPGQPVLVPEETDGST